MFPTRLRKQYTHQLFIFVINYYMRTEIYVDSQTYVDEPLCSKVSVRCGGNAG